MQRCRWPGVGPLGRLEVFLEPLGAGAAAVVDAVAAQPVDRAVLHDAEGRRPHAPARAVIASTTAPQRQEGLLGDVLGDRAPAAHTVGQRECGVRVALENDLERIGVTGGDELDELLVGKLSQPVL